MKNKIQIAIDGHSSCGKSTLAKMISKGLKITYIDTGAMYRAVALFFFENNIAFDNLEKINEAIPNVELGFSKVSNRILLNSVDVEDEIRKKYISEIVSEIAKIPEVRRRLVGIQKQMVEELSVVMDGRDIGTVVLPDADLKFFITADLETRVERRYIEAKSKGIAFNKDEIRENLEKRDYIDSTREDSPLKVAHGARIFDNSNFSIKQQYELLMAMINIYMEDNGIALN